MTNPNDQHAFRELLARVLGPGAPELTCEECFAQLDRYVELTFADAHPDQQIPGMRAHLEGCPACAEDYRSLRDFIRRSSQSRGG